MILENLVISANNYSYINNQITNYLIQNNIPFFDFTIYTDSDFNFSWNHQIIENLVLYVKIFNPTIEGIIYNYFGECDYIELDNDFADALGVSIEIKEGYRLITYLVIPKYIDSFSYIVFYTNDISLEVVYKYESVLWPYTSIEEAIYNFFGSPEMIREFYELHTIEEINLFKPNGKEFATMNEFLNEVRITSYHDF